MIYAVVDTNVFVSAFWTKKDDVATARLARCLQEGAFTPLYNDEILMEYQDVLSRPKFGFPKEWVNSVINYMKAFGINSARVPFGAFMPDEKDRVFYEVALSKENAYLVTGNQRHFPTDPIVVTPAEMLEILNKEK